MAVCDYVTVTISILPSSRKFWIDLREMMNALRYSYTPSCLSFSLWHLGSVVQDKLISRGVLEYFELWHAFTDSEIHFGSFEDWAVCQMSSANW